MPKTMTGSTMKDAILIGILFAVAAAGSYLSKTLVTGGNAKDPSVLGSRKLVRVVDLPDVPALHWRGGRYMDLGYLYDGKGGTWVAYLGPNEYRPLTSRKMAMMMKMAEQQGVMIDPSVPPDPDAIHYRQAPATMLADAGGNVGNETKTGGLTADEATAALPETRMAMGPSAKSDPLDMALLPEADRALITGSVSAAPEVAGGSILTVETGDEAGLQAPARLGEPETYGTSLAAGTGQPGAGAGKADLKVDPALMSASGTAGNGKRPAQTRNESAGAGWWLYVTGGLLLLGPLSVFGILRSRQRRSKSRMRDRMAAVMGRGRQSGSKARKATPHARKRNHHTVKLDSIGMDPQEALRAMQAAARGGLAT